MSRLDQLAGRPLSPDGDKYVADEDDYQFIKIAAKASNPSVRWFFRTTFKPPEYYISLSHSAFKSIATVWQQAG